MSFSPSYMRSLGQLKKTFLESYEALHRLRILGSKKVSPVIEESPKEAKVAIDHKLTVSAVSHNLEEFVKEQENEFEKALSEWAASGQENQKPVVTTAKGDDNSNTKKPQLNKSGIESRCRFLVKSISTAINPSSQLIRLEELCNHLLNYPDSKGLLVQDQAVRLALRLREYSKDESVRTQARVTLNLLGHTDPPAGPGIRILSIDGGGTRGIMAIEMLRELESRTGKKVHELFDLICGVSTGAILTILLGGLLMPLDQCSVLYKKMSCDIFNQNPWLGTGRLVWSHAYYDTSVWVNVLRTTYGEGKLYEVAKRECNPKIAVMSAVMNQPRLQPYMFRSYSLPYQSQSNYPGNCHHKAWEAIRASAAAPGYFEDYFLEGIVHQDGGLLWNNPTALAIHEAKLLWPGEELACVISLGTGRFIPASKPNVAPNQTISLKTKITRILDSATDTEGVHSTLHDLLPPAVYIRLNPYLSESVTMDETRPEKLQQLCMDTQMYMRRNEHKVAHAAKVLTRRRSKSQELIDWFTLRKQLYF